MSRRATVTAALLPILPAILFAGCTTPSTMLRNPNTGQVVTCGGNTSSSVAGGLIGYSIQKSSDDKCVSDYVGQGFTPVR